MMSFPKVSVCIPCYNCAEYIERSIMSVRMQTLKDIGIIVVDDGSKDDSLSIV